MRRPASLVILGIVIAVVFAGEAFSSSRISSFRVGGWTGGAYHNTQNHGFDRCAAQMAGTGNATIVYALDSRYVWSLELSSPAWNFLRGASLPVALRFGKHGSLATRAVAVSAHVLRVRLSNSLAIFENLRSVWRMEVIAGGLRLTFDLPYAGRVVQTLTQCVLRHQRRLLSAKERHFIKGQRAGRRRADPGLKAEASALGSQIITRTIGPKMGAVAAPAVQAAMNVDAAWNLHGFIFTVSALVPGPAPKLTDLPNVVIDRDAAACRGQFFAGAHFETSAAPRIALAFTNCTDPTKPVSNYYIGVTRKKGGFYLLSVLVDSREFNMAVDRAAHAFAGLVQSTLGAVLSEP